MRNPPARRSVARRSIAPPQGAVEGGRNAGTHPEAPHVGVHRRHRSPPHHREETPEEQGRLRHEEGGGERLHEFIRYVEGGCDPCPERITLAAYLNRWLDYQRARGIRSRTLDAYEGYIRREIVPVIVGLELGKVRPGHIRAVLSRVQQRGLSAATTAQVRSVLGSALRQAVADGLIAANPVAAVKRPRVQRRELRWPTSAQLGALLQASRGTLWEVPILLAVVTGARRAEVLGMSWERSQDGNDLHFVAGSNRFALPREGPRSSPP